MEPTELQKISLAYNDYRCNCGKLFFKGVIFNGGIEIKCPRCGQLKSFFGSKRASIPGRYAFLTNRDGRIINASDSVRDCLKCDPETLSGRNVSEFCGNAASEKTNKALISAITDDLHYFLAEICHQDKNGGQMPVRVMYKYLENNHGGFIVHIVDRLEASVPEESSAEAEEGFNQHQSADFMAELDNKSRIIYVSPELEDVLGYRPEEVLGRSVMNFCVPDEASWRGQNLRRVIADRISGRFDGQKLVHKDGHVVEYEACITPLYDDSGEAFGLRVVTWLKRQGAWPRLSAI